MTNPATEINVLKADLSVLQEMLTAHKKSSVDEIVIRKTIEDKQKKIENDHQRIEAEVNKLKRYGIKAFWISGFTGSIIGLLISQLPWAKAAYDYVKLEKKVGMQTETVNILLGRLKTDLADLTAKQILIESLNTEVVRLEKLAGEITSDVQGFRSEVDTAMKPYQEFKNGLQPKLKEDGTLQVKVLEIDGVKLQKKKTVEFGEKNFPALAIDHPLYVKQRIVVHDENGNYTQLMDRTSVSVLEGQRNGKFKEVVISK